MKLKIEARDIIVICKGGTCPTLFRSEDGRVFIQGYKVDSEVLNAACPPQDEDLVEITDELIRQIKEIDHG